MAFAYTRHPRRYTAITEFLIDQTGENMDRQLGRDMRDITLAESSVTIKLACIQARCRELLDDPDNALELTLDEPAPALNKGINPYENA